MPENPKHENPKHQNPKHQQPQFQQGNRPDSPKPESASKPGKRAYEERERDRASQVDQSHQDNARGDRNPGNFQNREAGRKSGER